MIPKYEDLEHINNISANLAARFAVLYDKIVALEIENKQLSKERDEARRDICDMHQITGFLSGDYAHSRGWDCFKDGYPQFSDETVKYRDYWNTYIKKLTSERDEARRMFCKCHAQAEAIGYAEGRGWDCFKEDNNE